MFKLSHRNLYQHNHPPTPDPFTLEPHQNRRSRRAKAIKVAKTYQGVLSFAESKEILKKMGLEIDAKSYYNLRGKEQSRTLCAYIECKSCCKEPLFLQCFAPNLEACRRPAETQFG
jgi:hypothetical protein